VTKEAKPNLITTYVYNGQSDPTAAGAIASCAPATAKLPDGKPIAVLCKRVEHATTDASGGLGFDAPIDGGFTARKLSWTYNSYGQPLTEVDAKGNATQYEYYGDTSFSGGEGHTVGDLKKVTNAALHVTTFDSYDKSGRLIQSIDPNQIVTRNVYNKRGFLTSTSVDGKTRTYEYDKIGNLKKLTEPDSATFAEFTYDEADRLIGIKDGSGTVEYTVDSYGNRTLEKYISTMHQLRRQVSRSIDALGRVQQVDGRE
jgi:YD repeat-containing protein